MKDQSKTKEQLIRELQELRFKNDALEKSYKKDIVGKEHTERALRQSESSLKYAQQIAKMGDWELDFTAHKTRWSENCFILFGLKPFEVEPTYEYFKSRVHPDDLHLLDDGYENMISNKKPISIELRILFPNGTIKWILNSIVPFFQNDKLIKLRGTNIDITDRKLIEEELHKFKLCIQQSFEAIFITDVQGNIIFSNTAFEQIYGYDSQETIGKTPRILKSGTYDASIYQDFWSQLLSKKTVFGEIINKTKDGRLITIDGYNSPILDSGGSVLGFIGIHRDITERKLSEEALRESRQITEGIMNSIPVGIFWKDKNLVYLGGNKTFANDAGYKSPGDIIGKNDYQMSWHEQAEMYRSDDFQVIESCYPKLNIEEPTTSSDGKVRTLLTNKIPLLDSNGVVNGVLGTYMDITQRKKAEESILKLSRAVEQSPASIIITDIDGEIEYVNPKVTEVTGYQMDELIGKNPRIFNSGYKPKPEYKILWDTLLAGKVWNGEFHNKRKNGELFWEQASISPIIDDRGNVTHYVSVKEDITQRKQMVNELIKAKEQAQESDRLKSAFLANMSHEIRTPMNGILGFTDLLKTPDLSGAEQQKYISIIEKSGDRMLNIINDIISISRIESGQIEVSISETNINEQIDYIHSFFKPEADKKGIKLLIQKTTDDKALCIKTDREKVYAILTNLLKNSIKYTPSGFVEFGYQIKSTTLEFFVKDTGIGIPKNRQKAIFERFIQADIEDRNAYQGAGLGLAISKAYVELLGGKIWVESEPDMGSIFYFTLPNLIELKENSVKEKIILGDDSEIRIENLHVLITEDDDLNHEYLNTIIENLGMRTQWAKNGEEAVQYCKENVDVDLILMDIQMPEMNGYEATKQIRKFNKEVVVIAQTALALLGDREKAIKAGCNDYISKPINKALLIKLIQKHFKV